MPNSSGPRSAAAASKKMPPPSPAASVDAKWPASQSSENKLSSAFALRNSTSPNANQDATSKKATNPGQIKGQHVGGKYAAECGSIALAAASSSSRDSPTSRQLLLPRLGSERAAATHTSIAPEVMARIARLSHSIGGDVMPLCLVLGTGSDLAAFRKGFFHENMAFLSQCLVDFASSPATWQERRAVIKRAMSSWMQENPGWERRCRPLPSEQQMSLLSVTGGVDLTGPHQVDLSQLFGNPSIAIILDDPVLLCAILNNGADVNDLYPCHLWRSPIRRFRFNLLHACVYYDFVDCFNVLMSQKEVDVNSIGDDRGHVLLLCLITAASTRGFTEHTSLSFLRSLVQHPSIDPDGPFPGGDAASTPLWAAIYQLIFLPDDVKPPRRCLAVVKTLIGAGANIRSIIPMFGVSPLHITRALAENETFRRNFFRRLFLEGITTIVPGGDEGLAQRSQQLLDVMQNRPATIINSVARGYLVRR